MLFIAQLLKCLVLAWEFDTTSSHRTCQIKHLKSTICLWIYSEICVFFLFFFYLHHKSSCQPWKKMQTSITVHSWEKVLLLLAVFVPSLLKKKQSSKHYMCIPTIYKCLRENIMVIPYMCVYYPHYRRATCPGAYEDLKIWLVSWKVLVSMSTERDSTHTYITKSEWGMLGVIHWSMFILWHIWIWIFFVNILGPLHFNWLVSHISTRLYASIPNMCLWHQRVCARVCVCGSDRDLKANISTQSCCLRTSRFFFFFKNASKFDILVFGAKRATGDKFRIMSLDSPSARWQCVYVYI